MIGAAGGDEDAKQIPRRMRHPAGCRFSRLGGVDAVVVRLQICFTPAAQMLHICNTWCPIFVVLQIKSNLFAYKAKHFFVAKSGCALLLGTYWRCWGIITLIKDAGVGCALLLGTYWRRWGIITLVKDAGVPASWAPPRARLSFAPSIARWRAVGASRGLFVSCDLPDSTHPGAHLKGP